MKKTPVIVGAIALTLAVVTIIILLSISNYGPEFKEVSHLCTPRITTMPPAKMLVVEATGEPEKTVGAAFGLLFKTYFKIKDRPKGNAYEGCRARWPRPLETPRDQWVGIYAMPVPASVTSIPAVPSKAGLHAELREWSYGTVAEILHVGSYAGEDTTVQKLRRFITENGYVITGDHEEVYLKGPGLLPTNPDKYLTIIRYEVRKVD